MRAVVLGVVFALAAGCANSPTDNRNHTAGSVAAGPTAEHQSDDFPDPGSYERAFEPLQFEGRGDDVVSDIRLSGGLAHISAFHFGRSNFAVWLRSADGEDQDRLLVNEIEIWSGSKYEPLRGTRYLLEIQADGEWEVVLSPPPEFGEPGAFNESGRGTTALLGKAIATGLHTVNLTHSGDSNFAVWFYTAAGRGELLVNEIGEYNGTRAIRIPANDIYYISVEADGRWILEFSS